MKGVREGKGGEMEKREGRERVEGESMGEQWGSRKGGKGWRECKGGGGAFPSRGHKRKTPRTHLEAGDGRGR